VLQDNGFEISFSQPDPHAGEYDTAAFSYRVAWLPDTAEAQLLSGQETILDSRKASSYTPVVVPLIPEGEKYYDIGESVPLLWQGEDKDGDALVYGVLIGHKYGNWSPLTIDSPEQFFDLDTTRLAPGAYWLKVTATDGFYSTETVWKSPIHLRYPVYLPFMKR